MKVIKTFEIEYDSELGVDWMCNGNLVLCLTSKDFFCGPGTLERVEEIDLRSVNDSAQRWVPSDPLPKAHVPTIDPLTVPSSDASS